MAQQLGLFDQLASTTPREKAGPTSSSRFDYQKNWTLCHLLELHQSGRDFVLICDFHDDVLVVDSATDPKSVVFYQVKGKSSGAWSVSELLKRTVGKKQALLSILGKMYDNKSRFKSVIESVNFVSNAPYNVVLRDGTDGSKSFLIGLTTLTDKDLSRIRRQLQAEHSLSAEPDVDDFFLHRTTLPITEHDTHTQGRVAIFMERLFPERPFRIPAVYRTLFSEIQRRSNYDRPLGSSSDVLTRKAITKAEFEQMLQQVAPSPELSSIVPEICSYLAKDDIDIHVIGRIRKEFTKYEVARMNASDTVLSIARASVSQAISDLESSGLMPKAVLDKLDIILRRCSLQLDPIKKTKSLEFCQAMILASLYGFR